MDFLGYIKDMLKIMVQADMDKCAKDYENDLLENCYKSESGGR